jgi:hypothetical protein
MMSPSLSGQPDIEINRPEYAINGHARDKATVTRIVYWHLFLPPILPTVHLLFDSTTANQVLLDCGWTVVLSRDTGVECVLMLNPLRL